MYKILLKNDWYPLNKNSCSQGFANVPVASSRQSAEPKNASATKSDSKKEAKKEASLPMHRNAPGVQSFFLGCFKLLMGG